MSSTAEMTAELKVAYSPNVVMTLRSNHTNPFVSKIGFDLNGPVVLGTKTKVNVDAAGYELHQTIVRNDCTVLCP